MNEYEFDLTSLQNNKKIEGGISGELQNLTLSRNNTPMLELKGNEFVVSTLEGKHFTIGPIISEMQNTIVSSAKHTNESANATCEPACEARRPARRKCNSFEKDRVAYHARRRARVLCQW